MNREIKFRVWCPGEQPKMQFVGGFLSSVDLDADYRIIMQFTGLKDKNGVEIYEGDIVNQFGFKAEGVVKFGTYTLKNFSNHDRQKSHQGWYSDPIPFKGSHDITWNQDIISLTSTINGLEVIGNIYENKELLE